MPRVVESRWTWEFRALIVRVWREEKELRIHYDNRDLTKIAEEWAYGVHQGKNLGEEGLLKLIKDLEACPRVNAVEITLDGDGVVLYPDWP